MSKNTIYVGNLPYEVTGEYLQSRFNQYGEIEKVNLHRDYDKGNKNKGFGFVPFSDDEDSDGGEAAAREAAKENGAELAGRTIRVDTDDDNCSKSGGGAHNRGDRSSYLNRGDRGDGGRTRY